MKIFEHTKLPRYFQHHVLSPFIYQASFW